MAAETMWCRRVRCPPWDLRKKYSRRGMPFVGDCHHGRLPYSQHITTPIIALEYRARVQLTECKFTDARRSGVQLVLFGFFIAPSLWVLLVPADNVTSR